MENPNKQSFVINIKIMKILRWYPAENKSKFYLIEGYILNILLLVVLGLLVAVKIFIEKKYDLMQVIYIGEITGYALKILPFLNENDRIKKCISFFDGVQFQPQDETEKKILDHCVALCQTMTKLYIYGIVCTGSLYLFPTLLSNGFELPLHIWLPYSYTSSSIAYYSTYIYLSIGSLYAGFATSLLDPLIGGLMFQAVSQFKILKHRIQNAEKIGEKMSNKKFCHNRIYQNVARCIKYHNAILDFVKEYEQCFSWTIFSQFMGTGSVLCFICVALVTMPVVTVEGAFYIALFSVVNWQILFYCYFGTLLYEESNTLVSAIYLSHWYEYSVETQKLLVILMERSKHPVTLSIGKLLDLTLDTFTAILKSSYSLVAVLK